MAGYESVEGVNLTEGEHPETFETINLIGEAESEVGRKMSGRQIAAMLIVRGGRDRVERIKERKQKANPEPQ